MPRAVNIEEKLLANTHAELQKRKTFEIGLLVALQGAKIDTILRFIRTPDAEEGRQATSLSSDWVLEHATQVARMLPGGVSVLGLYLLAPGSKFSALEPKLLSLLATLAKRLPAHVAEKQAVLLQLPTDSKKSACRVVGHGSTKLQPAELKSTPGAAQVPSDKTS